MAKTTYEDMAIGDFSLKKITIEYLTPFVKIALEKYNGSDTVATVPDGTMKIEVNAFCDCENLREVHFPPQTCEFKSAFSKCPALEAIYFDTSSGIKFYQGAFYGIEQPIKVYFGGSSDVWQRSVADWYETESEYDCGWGGGAPGLYSTTWRNSPMHHQLGEDFFIEVYCKGDDTTFIMHGKSSPRCITEKSTPYD